MKASIILFLFSISLTAASQTLDGMQIELKILKDTLTTSFDDLKIDLDFRIQNLSRSNVIMYAFNERIIGDVFGRMEPFCEQGEGSAAIILYVFDKNLRPVTATQWYVNDIKNPFNKQRFDSVMAKTKAGLLKATVVLETSKAADFTQEVFLHEFNLLKGTYFIQLLYFAGKRITNFVSENQIEIDKKMFNARVYQGCIISNKSVLVVK